MKILSFDVSAASTGWAFTDGKKFKYGFIKTSPKNSRPERLTIFREEIVKLLKKLKPSHVVMEDLFYGLNPKTLIILAKFAGIVEECCNSVANIEPHIMHTNTVKAYFKVKNKENVFNCVKDIFELKDFTFKKHNDLTDALAMLLCYCDQISDRFCFRCEKEYGYLYEV